MASDNRDILYGELSKEGNFGTREQFDQALENPSNVQAAYDIVKGRSPEYGETFDDFKSWLGGSLSTTATDNAAARESLSPPPPTDAEPGVSLDEVSVVAPGKKTTPSAVTEAPAADANPFADKDEQYVTERILDLQKRAELNRFPGDDRGWLYDDELKEYNQAIERYTQLEDEANNFVKTKTKNYSDRKKYSDDYLYDILTNKGEAYISEGGTMMERAMRRVEYNSAYDEYSKRMREKEQAAQVADTSSFRRSEVSETLSPDMQSFNDFGMDYSDDKERSARVSAAIENESAAYNNIATWAKTASTEDIRTKMNEFARAFGNRNDSTYIDGYNDHSIACYLALSNELAARERGGHGSTLDEMSRAATLAEMPEEARAWYEKYHNKQAGLKTEGGIRVPNLAPGSHDPISLITQSAMDYVDKNVRSVGAEYDKRIMQASAGATNPYAGYGMMMESEVARLKVSDYTAALKHAADMFDKNELRGFILHMAEINHWDYETARQKFSTALDQEFRRRLTEKFAPKSATEFFVREVFNSLTFLNIQKGLVYSASGLSEKSLNPYSLDAAAMDKWRKENTGFVNSLVKFGATAVGAIADAASFGFVPAGSVGGVVGSLSSRVAAKVFYGSGSRAVVRSVAGKFGMKAVQTITSGSATLGTYSFYSSAASQYASVGVVDWGASLEAAGHGAVSGVFCGVTGATLDKAFKGVSGRWVYGAEAVKILGEAGAFTASGMLMGEGFSFEKFGDNLSVILGMKFGTRETGRYIQDVRRRATNDKTMIKETNVTIDRITQEEAASLADKGYGDLARLLQGNPKDVDLNAAIEQHNKMVGDNSVPFNTKAISQYILKGTVAQPPLIADYKAERNADGQWVVTALDSNKNPIDNGVVMSGTEQRNAYIGALRDKISINNVVMSEMLLRQHEDMQAVRAAAAEAARTLNEEQGTTAWNESNVMKTYSDATDGTHKMTPAEETVVKALEKHAKKPDYSMSSLVDEVSREHGVDIRKAMSKGEGLTDKERAAIKDLQQRVQGTIDNLSAARDAEVVQEQAKAVDAADAVATEADAQAVADNTPNNLGKRPEPESAQQGEKPEQVSTPKSKKEEPKTQDKGEVVSNGQLSETDKQQQATPPAGQETPPATTPAAPTAESTPAKAETPEQPKAETPAQPSNENRETPSVEYPGEPADIYDAIAFDPKNRAYYESLSKEDQAKVAAQWEAERRQAHDYAAGRTDEKPPHYEEWKERDKLDDSQRETSRAETQQSAGVQPESLRGRRGRMHDQYGDHTFEVIDDKGGDVVTISIDGNMITSLSRADVRRMLRLPEERMPEKPAEQKPEPPKQQEQQHTENGTENTQGAATEPVAQGEAVEKKEQAVEPAPVGTEPPAASAPSAVDNPEVKAAIDRLNDPNASEFERERSRQVLRSNGVDPDSVTNPVTPEEVARQRAAQDLKALEEQARKNGLVIDEDDKAADIVNQAATALGLSIETYHDAEGGNGYYQNGVIHVNTARPAQVQLAFVLGHEMTHGMDAKSSDTSPGVYQRFKDTANNYLKVINGEEGYRKMLDETRERYKGLIDAAYAEEKAKDPTLDYDQFADSYAADELASDVAGHILTDAKNARKVFSSITDKGMLQSMRTAIMDFIDHIIAKLPGTSERRKEMLKVRDELNNMFEALSREREVADGLDKSMGGSSFGEGGRRRNSTSANAEGCGFEVFDTETVMGDDGVERTVKKPILDEEGNVCFKMGDKVFNVHNKVTAEDIKTNSNSALNYMMADALRFGTITKTQAEKIYRKYADMMNAYLTAGAGKDGQSGFGELEKTWMWVGETVFRTIASNSDAQYAYSMDITRVCKKNEAVIKSISALQVKCGYGITPAQILDVYLKAEEAGYQVPCPVCYVFSRYITNGQFATSMVSAMRRFGDNLPGGSDPKPLEWWVEKLDELKAERTANKKRLDNAKKEVQINLQEIDKLSKLITSGRLSPAEVSRARRLVEKYDARYRAALDVVSQESLDRFITTFVLKEEGKGDDKTYSFREDARKPEDMDDFVRHALDIRLTGSAASKYPGIGRYNRKGGASAGKEIAFASNNEIGDVAMGLGLSDLKEYPNWYKLAAEASDPKQREEYLSKASKRFESAAKYVKRQTLRGGQRMWSWSDNIEMLAPDVASNLMQLEMLGGALQTYSKQLEGVELVAAMNGYVNASLMGYGNGWKEIPKEGVVEKNGELFLKEDLYDTDSKGRERLLAKAGSPIYTENGKHYTLAFDDIVGIAAYGKDGKRGLFDLNEEYDRAGNILVGMNDIHVRAAMADNRIFFIIPWHASGMSNHILTQMMNALGIRTGDFKGTDYTKMQEEHDHLAKNDKGKYKYPVYDCVVKLWDTHTFEKEFSCGLGHIENGDGKGFLSAGQLKYRSLRDAIFEGRFDSLPDEDKQAILNDEFLKQVYEKVLDGVVDTGLIKGKDTWMTSKDKEYIYPYEYWDKNSSFTPRKGKKGADVNGRRYVEYCRRLGVTPKFSGAVDWKIGFRDTSAGNFIDDPGYWKLLIDRRMYDRNGDFQDLTPIESKGLETRMYDPKETEKLYDVTKVADDEGAEKIADEVYKTETERTGSMPQVNYDQTLTEASDKYVQAVRRNAYDKEDKALQERVRPDEEFQPMNKRTLSAGDRRESRGTGAIDAGEAKDERLSGLRARAVEALRKAQEQSGDVGDVSADGDSRVRYSLVTDPDEIKRLDSEPVLYGYRNVSLMDDGSFRSPMANKLGKKGEKSRPTEGFKLDTWERSDENPDLATDDGKINLIKPNGLGSVGSVDYNPYIHIRPTTLNKQFKNAWERDDLVYIKTAYPESELANGYHAEKAALPVGKHPWGGGELILSRWDKPVAWSKESVIVPWEEVAKEWVKEYKDTGVHFDIVPPKLLPILMEQGIEILPPHKGMGEACNAAYREKVLGEKSGSAPEDGKPELPSVKGYSENSMMVWHNDRVKKAVEEGRTGSLEFLAKSIEKEIRRIGKYSSESARQWAKDYRQMLAYANHHLERMGKAEGNESWGVKRNKAMSIDEIDGLFKKYNTDEHNAELWEKVMAVSRRLGVDSIKFAGNLGEYTFGKTFGGVVRFNESYFNSWVEGNDAKCATLLHEMLHHATSYAFKAFKRMDNNMPKEMHRAVGKILKVFDTIKEDPDFKGSYGSTDAREMLAEISNPAFRAKLKAKDLWQKLVDGIMEFLGFESPGAKQTTAYEQVRSSLETLLETPQEDVYNRYASWLRDERAYYAQRDGGASRENPDGSALEETATASPRTGTNAPKYSLSVEEQEAQTHTDNFKRWFGDWERDPENASKVVDKDGRPLVMSHNTENEFYTFDRERIGSGQGQAFLGMGFNFSRGRNSTYGGREMKVFLDAKNPLESDGHKLSQRDLEGALRKIDEGQSDTVVAEFAGNYAPYGTREYDAAVKKVARDLVENYDDLGIYGSVSVVAGAHNAEKVIGAFKGLGYDSSIERDRDGRIMNAVVFDPEQIKSATENNGDFSRENPDIRFSISPDDERRPTFYSNAERAVENVKQNKATAEQWKAMLTKAGGIKAGEDKWMGLSAWLDDHKGESLTKDEVLEFVRENGIQMEEVNYGEGLDGMAIYDRYGLGEHKYGGESLPWTEWFDLFPDGIEFQGNPQERLELADIVNNKDHFVNKGNYDLTIRSEEERYIRDTEKELFDFVASQTPNGRPINSTRLIYTTKGLKNKREIAFKVPNVEPYQESDDIHFGLENGGRAVMWVRFGETTDANGKRVLVIDEVQSSRHQDARGGRYKSEINQNALDEGEKLRKYLVEKYGDSLNEVETEEELEAILSKEDYERYKDVNNAFKAEEYKLRRAVPDAPFEKNWHEVAMKRMLRLAAEEGFDKVAWTTGEQQANRYNLGKKISELVVGKDFADDENSYWYVAKGNQGSIVAQESHMSKQQLADVIGKDLTNKAAEKTDIGEDATFSGEGLRIGGEGMKGFYDQMLPRFMDKYGKKWGVKTGEVTLATPGKEVMHSVDVTPKMRADVRKGQPLFSLSEDKIGDGVHVSDAEVAAVGRDESESPLRRMAAQAVSRARRQVDDGLENGGVQAVTVGGMPGVRFALGDFSERDKATARQRYNSRMSSALHQVAEALQDSMLSLKALMQEISGVKHIEDVPGYENSYLAENAMSSATIAQYGEWDSKYYNPLVKEITRLANASVGGRARGKAAREQGRQAVADYMMAKHGLERNVVLAARDAKEEYESDANKDANGNYIRSYADILAEKRKKDYSGLTALTGKSNVADAEAAAQQMVANYEFDHDTTELWRLTNAATKATLETLFRGGVLSKATYDRIRDMFDYYIPLQGWEETTSDEVYGYLTSKDGPIYGNTIKHAEGRRSKADDPIATIALMGDNAIREANRNLMKSHFLTFVQNHPSDLVSIDELWLQYDAAHNEWHPVFADLDPSDSGDEVRQKVEAFNQRMEALAASDPNMYKRSSQNPDIPYKVVKGNMNEHQVICKWDGKTYVMTVNGSPRAAQALNGMSNPDNKLAGGIGTVLNYVKRLSRGLSTLYTQINPKFIPRNFVRDVIYSTSESWVRDGSGADFHKNAVRFVPTRMASLLKKYENGTLNRGDQVENMFYEFMHNGGETGYSAPKDIEQFKKQLDKAMRRENSTTRQVVHAFAEWYNRQQRAIENSMRFAAFVTARESGKNIEQSIYAAKQVSVNFNKKGAGTRFNDAPDQTTAGKVAGVTGDVGMSLFAFWNAGVQGLTNYGLNFKRHPIKQSAHTATFMVLGYLMSGLWHSDDEEGEDNSYFNLPSYTRRSSLCLPLGSKTGQWATIPLPIELSAAYGMGELFGSLMSGHERMTNAEVAKEMTALLTGALPIDPLTEGGLPHALLPTAVKPLVEAYGYNESWTGAPVSGQTPYNEHAPEYTRVRKNTNPVFVAATKWLNDVTTTKDSTKGIINWNPDCLEYVFKGYGGGISTLINDISATVWSLMDGDKQLDWHKIPVVGGLFATNNKDSVKFAITKEYWKYMDEIKDVEADLKVLKDNPQRLAEYQSTDRYKRYLKILEYKKEAEKARKTGTSEEFLEKAKELIDGVHAFEDGKQGLNPEAQQELAESAAEKEEKEERAEVNAVIDSYTEQQMDSAFVATGDYKDRERLRDRAEAFYLTEEQQKALKDNRDGDESHYNHNQSVDDLKPDIIVEGRTAVLEKGVVKQLKELGVIRKQNRKKNDPNPWMFQEGLTLEQQQKAREFFNAHKAELDEYEDLKKLHNFRNAWNRKLAKQKDEDVRKEYRKLRDEYFKLYPTQ